MNSRDQSHLLTNGHLTSQQNANNTLHRTTSQLRDNSAGQVTDANGGSVTVSLGSSLPRPPRDSAFSPRGPLRREVPTDTQRMQQHLPSSPERRNPGPDINPSAHPSLHTSGRDQPPLREMRPYDHERDFNRVHETHEQDRERMRERRWSLTDHRRFDHDRRSFDNDRRFPPDSRRSPSYDRRPPQSNDRRPHHFEDKQHSGVVDRLMLNDCRSPDYEHRPLSEEAHTGNAPSQDRSQEALENLGATPTSLPGSNGLVDDLLHNRVSEPLHATNSRPGLNDDQERYSKPTGDNQTRHVSAACPSALSVGPEESRPQPPPPPPPLPPLSASTPSTFSSTQPSPSARTREPSRERPSNFRPYFRSEFSRPLEDTRRPDAHSAQPGDSLRRYDERVRWSPPPYVDRRGYRDHYDRDRPYWDNKDRARVLPTPAESMPPSYWDRERTRYPEPSYTGTGQDRRFEEGNRDRWYPPSYDNTSRRQFDRLAPRGRPRSPGSPSREPTELRPPPPKRARDDAFVGGHSATGDDYYSTSHPHHPPPPPPPGFSTNKESLPPRPPSGSLPVPIPTSRPTPLPPQPRYSHNRASQYETYGGPYGGYERDGGRGLAGSSYPREGSR